VVWPGLKHDNVAGNTPFFCSKWHQCSGLQLSSNPATRKLVVAVLLVWVAANHAQHAIGTLTASEKLFQPS
jgi:hypothetical protein